MTRRSYHDLAVSPRFHTGSLRSRRGRVQIALGNAFAAAQLGYRVLAAQAVQHDADLLFGGVTLARRPADVLDDFFR